MVLDIHSSSFTIFKDNFYWLNATNKEIRTCDNMTHCHPTTYQDFTDETVNEILAYDPSVYQQVEKVLHFASDVCVHN